MPTKEVYREMFPLMAKYFTTILKAEAIFSTVFEIASSCLPARPVRRARNDDVNPSLRSKRRIRPAEAISYTGLNINQSLKSERFFLSFVTKYGFCIILELILKIMKN